MNSSAYSRVVSEMDQAACPEGSGSHLFGSCATLAPINVCVVESNGHMDTFNQGWEDLINTMLDQRPFRGELGE